MFNGNSSLTYIHKITLEGVNMPLKSIGGKKKKEAFFLNLNKLIILHP